MFLIICINCDAIITYTKCCCLLTEFQKQLWHQTVSGIKALCFYVVSYNYCLMQIHYIDITNSPSHLHIINCRGSHLMWSELTLSFGYCDQFVPDLQSLFRLFTVSLSKVFSVNVIIGLMLLVSTNPKVITLSST